MSNTHKENLIKAIVKLGPIYSVWDVFSDFTALSALSIANSTKQGSKELWDAREAEYIKIIGKYSKEESAEFPIMLAELTLALEYESDIGGGPHDVLGEVFHALELHNKYKGQFFTPQSICEMMSEITLDKELDERIKENGYVTLCEPCCGSGAMILGFAKALKKRGYNYCSQLYAEAIDKDLRCVYMFYIQLSLYGIPAMVIHGNFLALETYSCWATPLYIDNDWNARLQGENKSGVNAPKNKEDATYEMQL